ncbi:hypothetical protein [Paraburkholderia hospita]|nr:hypothetical protein [Paraburkholderia hospita]
MRILLSAMHDGRCETARAASVLLVFPDPIGPYGTLSAHGFE